jgi:AcrR family transcriptional regulator
MTCPPTELATDRPDSRQGSADPARAELITAARELLATSPSSRQVSLRRVAATAGVSPAAIYQHFIDKQDLLDAVARQVFGELERALDRVESTFVDPAIRLNECAVAYVRFARQNPCHYRHVTLEKRLHSELPDAASWGTEMALRRFRAAASECAGAGLFASHDAELVALQHWALAHGIAALQLTRPDLPWGELEAFTRRPSTPPASARDLPTGLPPERV